MFTTKNINWENICKIYDKFLFGNWTTNGFGICLSGNSCKI